jgi:soluble P-type ATPase
MIEIQVPGGKDLILNHLVLDYNGTLAKDGHLYPKLSELLTELSEQLQVHVVTADTVGGVKKELEKIDCKISILKSKSQDYEKLAYINTLGKQHTIAIGNGRNDSLMIKAAALGIAVIQEEGAWGKTVQAADVVCNSIFSALELLMKTSRLKATLRI